MSQPLADRLLGLGAWLKRHKPLWDLRPYVGEDLSWAKAYPELANALASLAQQDLDRLEHEGPFSMKLPRPWSDWANACRDWSHKLLDPAPMQKPLPHLEWRHHKALKRAQIEGFLAHLPQPLPKATTHGLDYCAGQAHLGRQFAKLLDLPVQALERDPALCEQGRKLAQQEGLELCFDVVDVTQPLPTLFFKPDTFVVALHACGHLNVRLIRQVQEHPVAGLALAPCCWDKLPERTWRPLSKLLADNLPFSLESHHLRLVSVSESQASEHRSKRRVRRQLYVLALNLLLDGHQGKTRYRVFRPIPNSLLETNLETFCKTLADGLGFSLPTQVEWPALEALAQARLLTLRGLGLVRALFRRPLEVFLALDRAQALCEFSYQVRLFEFCSFEASPRNLMILAESP